MSKFATKVASALLTATTVVSLSGLGSFAGVASAQTVDIASLLAQIAALQAQLASLQAGQGGAATSACTFTRDLTVGASGNDVTCLQQVLVAKGYLTMPAGVAYGYFGNLTKTAVAKWQAASGIAPAAGYFGPKSRGAFAAMGGVQPGPGGTPIVVNPGTSLFVSAGAGSPTGSAIAGAGQIAVGRFNFTAPASMGVTITGLTFNKVGVVSDSNISNLYLADVASGAIVAQYQSLTNSVATFGGLMLNVAAGQTWVGELRADISTSATAGNTIAFDLTGVTTAGNTAVGGLPVKGNVLTVTTVSNPSIATVSLTANAVGSTIDAGTNSALISSWTASVTNSAVELRSMQFAFVGSANPSDIRNLRLMVNGSQVATLATASTETVFAFAGSPVRLNTGQSTVEIFADVAGSPNRTFTLSLLQPYRVNAVDTQYGAGITATITSTNQTTITINTGSVTVQTASNSPSTPVPAGASSVVIAKFTIYAAGEPVKVKFLDADFTQTGAEDWTSTITTITDDLSNVRLIDDAGGQVGNNISTIAEGSSSGQCTIDSTTVISCHFGTSGSPINYIVPANTTRTISLMADIGSSTDMTTVRGSLPTMTTNLEGQISFQSASSGTATGATRSVNSSPLTVAANSGYTSPTFIAGETQAKIASFVLTASSAQAARISSLTFDKDSNSDFDMQSMVVKYGSNQFGTTRNTIGTEETSLAFSNATPITVPAGGSVTVDVYADILTTTTATTHSAVIDLTGWSALGVTSGSSIAFPGAASGQSVVVSSGPTLTVALGSDTPPIKQLVMDTDGNSLMTLRFTNNNVADVRITDLTVSDVISNGSSGVASFESLELYDGTTKVAGPISMTVTGAASGSIAFNLTQPVTVAKNGSKTLTLKGGVSSYSEGAVSNSSHVFKFSDNDDVTVIAIGAPSATVTVSGAPQSGNAQSVYRTRLTVTGSNRTTAGSRTANEDVGTLSFAADSNYQAVLNSLTITFSGAAVTTHAGGTSFTVELIDPSTGIDVANTSDQTCTPVAVTSPTSCNVTFTPVYTVDAGTTKTFTVRINSASFYNGDQSETLSVQVTSTGGITFYDGVTPSTALPATVFPITVATLTY